MRVRFFIYGCAVIWLALLGVTIITAWLSAAGATEAVAMLGWQVIAGGVAMLSAFVVQRSPELSKIDRWIGYAPGILMILLCFALGIRVLLSLLGVPVNS